MPRSGRFERRLLVALVLFSLIPTVLVMGVGTLILREAVSLQTTPAGWERLRETGRVLLDRAEESGDPDLVDAARAHRDELSLSVQQAQRWGYLNRRIMRVIPWIALAFFGTLTFLAVRWARRTARGFASPIAELVGWSARIGRGESLPPPSAEENDASGEFAVLRQSFRTMTAELEASRERALEAARMKASISLARGVAHELKNALTPLRLAVRVLQANRGLDSELHEPLEVIDAESRRLEGLALAFSRFGQPPEGPRSPIDLRELLESIGRTHVPPGIDFILETAPSGDGRPDRNFAVVDGYHEALTRAIGNIVLNAVEAITDHGTGGVITARLRECDATAEIELADSGPGLPADADGRLWDADFTTKSRGTGLGLALVRQTILAHGGSIEARSGTGPEGGAVFLIRLPLAQSASAKPSGSEGAPTSESPVGSGNGRGGAVADLSAFGGASDRRPDRAG